MVNHRRWPALLLIVAMTLSSVSVLAMAGDDQSTTVNEPPKIEAAPNAEPADESRINTDMLESALANAQTDPAAEPEADASEPDAPQEDPDALKLMLNGQRLELDVEPVIMGGNTFVSLRAFAEALGCSVQWSPSGLTTVVREGELRLEVQTGSDLICANDRYFYMPEKAVAINGSLMVPVRGMAKVFTFTVDWIKETNTVSLSGGKPLEAAESFYDSEDLLWLSRIIHAESRGEPLEGKIAVGNVVINRTKAPQFPDTIYDVIFDKKHGTQFTPTKTGNIYNTPTEECVLAAKLCLEGHTTAENALYFLSSSSASGWIVRTRTLIARIGNHSFFA